MFQLCLNLLDIEPTEDYYVCKKCSTYLSTKQQIISSKCLTDEQDNKRFLVDDVMNVYFAKNEKRTLRSDTFMVANMHCIDCHSVLGWKSIEAHDDKEVSILIYCIVWHFYNTFVNNLYLLFRNTKY